MFTYPTVGPLNVTVGAIASTVVEMANDLNMSCTVPGGSHGNPTTYTYYWTNKDTGYQQHGTDKTFLTIPKDQLNAAIHNGNLSCKAGNNVGNSTESSIIIAVDGKLNNDINSKN